MKDKTQFVEYLRVEVEKAHNAVKVFKTTLNNDSPEVAARRVYLLTEAAAVIDVYGSALDALTSPDSKATLDSIHEYALGRVLVNAQSWPTNSYDQKVAAAWAHLIDDMKWRT